MNFNYRRREMYEANLDRYLNFPKFRWRDEIQKDGSDKSLLVKLICDKTMSDLAV